MDILQHKSYKTIFSGLSWRLASWLLAIVMVLILVFYVLGLDITGIKDVLNSTEPMDEAMREYFNMGVLFFVLTRVFRIVSTLSVITGISGPAKALASYDRARDWFMSLMALDCFAALVNALEIALSNRGLLGDDFEHGKLLFDSLTLETEALGVIILSLVANLFLLRGFQETALLIGADDKKQNTCRALRAVLSTISGLLILTAGTVLIFLIFKVNGFTAYQLPDKVMSLLMLLTGILLFLRLAIQLGINRQARDLAVMIKEISE